MPDAPENTYGDSAYSGSKPEAAIRAWGGRLRVVHTGTWGGAEALARLQAHNAEVRRVQARIEKVFGTAKRTYGQLGVQGSRCSVSPASLAKPHDG